MRVDHLELELGAGLTAGYLGAPAVSWPETELVLGAQAGLAGGGFRPPLIESGRGADGLENTLGRCLDPEVMKDVSHVRVLGLVGSVGQGLSQFGAALVSGVGLGFGYAPTYSL